MGEEVPTFPEYLIEKSFVARLMSHDRIQWLNLSAEVLDEDPVLCSLLLKDDEKARNALHAELIKRGRALKIEAGYSPRGMGGHVNDFIKRLTPLRDEFHEQFPNQDPGPIFYATKLYEGYCKIVSHQREQGRTFSQSNGFPSFERARDPTSGATPRGVSVVLDLLCQKNNTSKQILEHLLDFNQTQRFNSEFRELLRDSRVNYKNIKSGSIASLFQDSTIGRKFIQSIHYATKEYISPTISSICNVSKHTSGINR